MVSIIKNQLLKHLQRYTKNLSPDKVNLSAFRGEGELSNLQLDENVLTDLLELPAWLRLTSAWCNHVSFRISWTKLKSTPITLTKFGTRCRAWNVAPHNPEAPPCVAVRLEEVLTLPADSLNITDKKSIQSWFKRKLNVEVKNINLQLSMSTVVGLGDLAEDEVIPTPIPMEVMLENVKINLIEDRPPVNITSPGTLPMNVAIGRMFVTRDEAGVFCLQPMDKGEAVQPVLMKRSEQESRKERDREVLSLQLVMQQLKLDNENLRKQLTSNEKIFETNKVKFRQENEVLRSYLKAAQDDVSSLLEEKRTLMDTIRSLQNQLTALSDTHLNATDGKR